MRTRTTTALAAAALALGVNPVTQADDDTNIRAGVRITGEQGSIDLGYAREDDDDHFEVRARSDEHRYRRRGYPGRRSDRPRYRPLPRGRRYDPVPRPRYESPSTPYDHGKYGLRAERNGWRYIGERRPVKAQRAFRNALGYDEYNASAKAGYAVAGALRGDYHRASWAMRRAINVDVHELAYFSPGPRVSRRLSELAASITYSIHDYEGDADSYLLLAGIELLRGNDYGALEAAREARRMGDESRAVRKLIRLLKHKDED